jgi:hypothetical protein
MRSIRRSGVTALTAAIALSIGVIPVAVTVPSMVASEEGSTTLTPADQPLGAAGTLTLATVPGGRTGTVTYVNGASTSTQNLQVPSKGCTISTQPTLLSFVGLMNGSAAPGGVGFDGNSIGVAEKASGAGTSCAQVDSVGSESLTLKLGSSLPAGTLMSGATLDLEFKQGAAVTGTAYRGTNPTPVGTWVKTCNDGTADSGPDSKYGDNCTRYFGADNADVYFDRLVLSITPGSSGAFGVEGGADWTDPDNHRSVITLVSTIDCNTSVTLPGSGTTPTVKATRLDNATTGSACSPFLYTFTNGDQKAEFVKPGTDQPDAQFLFDFTWTIDPANTSHPNEPLVAPTTADFDGAGGNDPVKLVWCPDLVKNDKGYLVVSNPKDKPDQAPGFPTVDTTQFACIVSQQTTLMSGTATTADDDKVLVKELIYVYGDILMKKG